MIARAQRNVLLNMSPARRSRTLEINICVEIFYSLKHYSVKTDVDITFQTIYWKRSFCSPKTRYLETFFAKKPE